MALGKCIICGNDADGALVADSRVIKFIRALKQKLGMAQNNTLVVCPLDMATHEQKRKKFENKLSLNIIIGAFVILILVVLPIFLGGPFNLTSLILGPLLALFIAALALTDYMPQLAESASTIPLENPPMAQQISMAGARKESYSAPPAKKSSAPARHASAKHSARKTASVSKKR